MVSVPVCIACLMPTMASVSWACEDDKTSDDDPDQTWLSILPAAAESETDDESTDEHDESNDNTDTAQSDGNDRRQRRRLPLRCCRLPPVWEEEHYWEESLHTEAMFVDGFTRIKEIQHHKRRLRSRWHQSQHLRNSPAEDF